MTDQLQAFLLESDLLTTQQLAATTSIPSFSDHNRMESGMSASSLFSSSIHPNPNESPSKAAQRKAMALKEQEKMLDEFRKENFNLRLLVTQLEEELAQKYPGYAEDLKLKANLAAQLKQLQSEIDERKFQVDQLQHRQQEQQQQNTSFADFNRSSADELKQLRQENNRQQAELQQAQQTIRALNEQLNNNSPGKIRRSIDQDYQSRIVAMESERDKLTQRMRELEPLAFQLEMANCRIKELESGTAQPNEILESTIRDQRAQIEELELANVQAKSQLVDQNSLLARRAVEIEQLKSEVESLHIRLSDYNYNNVAAAASTSMFDASNILGGQSILADGNRSFASFAIDRSFELAPNMPQHQLEQGITLLRNQISDLKMQLIEKRSAVDQLNTEMSANNQSHDRKTQKLMDSWKNETTKLNEMIEELRQQLEKARNDQRSAVNELERLRVSRHSDETAMQIQIQTLESNLNAAKQEIKRITGDHERNTEKLRIAESTLEIKEAHLSNLNRQLDSRNALVQSAESQRRQSEDQSNARVRQLTSQVLELTSTAQDRESQLQMLKDQLERQKDKLISLEESWARQTKEAAQQQRQNRDQLEEQIVQFKRKSEELSLALAERDSQLRDVKTKLDLHSVGVETSNRFHEQEKERLKLECKEGTRALDEQQRQLTRQRQQLEELQRVQKDSAALNERLSSNISALERKIHEQKEEHLQTLEVIDQKDKELRDKLCKIKELQQRLAACENALIEGKQSTEIIEGRYKLDLDERNELLCKLDAGLSKVIVEVYKSKNEPAQKDLPGNNFMAFADSLVRKIQRLNSIAAKFEQRCSSIEQSLQEQLRVINKKLEKRTGQVERFESIVQEAIGVQKRLKDSLTEKQEELNDARMMNLKLQNEITVQKHQIVTAESSSSFLSAAERTRLADALANVAELERQVKDREMKIKREKEEKQELETSHMEETTRLQKRIEGLTADLRRITEEFNSCQKRIQYLERNNTTLSKQSSSNLFETTEMALKNLSHKYKEDAETARAELDAERAKNREREELLMKLRNDYKEVKRRLFKKETMIEMALSKLELVNQRRDSVEAALLYQFTNDVKRMMQGSSQNIIADDTAASTTISQQSSPAKRPLLAILAAHEESLVAERRQQQQLAGATPASNEPRPSKIPEAADPNSINTFSTTKPAGRKRQHVNNACINCKRSHLACDNTRPCQRCVRSGREDTCLDFQHRRRGRPPATPTRAKMEASLLELIRQGSGGNMDFPNNRNPDKADRTFPTTNAVTSTSTTTAAAAAAANSIQTNKNMADDSLARASNCAFLPWPPQPNVGKQSLLASPLPVSLNNSSKGAVNIFPRHHSDSDNSRSSYGIDSHKQQSAPVVLPSPATDITPTQRNSTRKSQSFASNSNNFSASNISSFHPPPPLPIVSDVKSAKGSPQSAPKRSLPMQGMAIQLDAATLTVQDACAPLLGFSPQEGLFRMSIYNIVHEMDRQKLVQFHKLAFGWRKSDISLRQEGAQSANGSASLPTVDVHLRNIHGVYQLYTLAPISAADALTQHGLRCSQPYSGIILQVNEYQHPFTWSSAQQRRQSNAMAIPISANSVRVNGQMISPVSPAVISTGSSKDGRRTKFADESAAISQKNISTELLSPPQEKSLVQASCLGSQGKATEAIPLSKILHPTTSESLGEPSVDNNSATGLLVNVGVYSKPDCR